MSEEDYITPEAKFFLEFQHYLARKNPQLSVIFDGTLILTNEGGLGTIAGNQFFTEEQEKELFREWNYFNSK